MQSINILCILYTLPLLSYFNGSFSFRIPDSDTMIVNLLHLKLSLHSGFYTQGLATILSFSISLSCWTSPFKALKFKPSMIFYFYDGLQKIHRISSPLSICMQHQHDICGNFFSSWVVSFTFSQTQLLSYAENMLKRILSWLKYPEITIVHFL